MPSKRCALKRYPPPYRSRVDLRIRGDPKAQPTELDEAEVLKRFGITKIPAHDYRYRD
jgi:hypothetical protein